MANSWRRERWDSLRLLTPNWQSRLPGYRYDGADPDGFMTTARGRSRSSSRFAAVAAAPVRTQTTVTSVRPTDGGYHVATTDRRACAAAASCWRAAPATSPNVPALRAGGAAVHRRASRRSTTAIRTSCPTGGVLVVGASATGVQLADEIHRSGRPVTLSVGEHVRLPRTYRGRDVLWWMDASGVWNQRYDEIDDLDARAPAAVAAAGRHAGARDAGPQRARRGRRRARRPAGRRCATAGRCSRAACATSSRWPT